MADAQRLEHSEQCFLCRKHLKLGSEGIYCAPWRMTICGPCRRANWDSIDQESYPHLLPHLQTENLRFSFNRKGFLEWPKSSAGAGRWPSMSKP